MHCFQHGRKIAAIIAKLFQHQPACFLNASSALAANATLGTVGTDGTVTGGATGTLVQGGTFILGHANFDKTLSSNAKMVASLPTTERTQVQFEVDTGAISEATAATGTGS